MLFLKFLIFSTFPRKCFVLGVVSFIIITRFSQVLGDCKSSGKAHRKGDIWNSADNCYVYECGKNARVSEYKRICPTVPPCIPSQVYKKDCCEYCHEGTIPTQDNGHACKRKCERGDSMKCKYTFSLEVFQSLSLACFDCPSNKSDCDRENCIPADGITRLINVANRMMPGPAIEVCVNDTIVVDVQNNFLSQEASIHWYGIQQRKNPYADGVPFVTQCPIRDFDTFRYVFPVEDAGTYSWRSSLALEIMDGIQGSLIVRQPINDDPHEKLYDMDEHTMFLQDWYHHYSEQQFYAYYMANGSLFPDNILINGRGRILKAMDVTFVYSSEDESHVSGSAVPFAEFRVSKGNRYRIRIISGANSDCPLAISIDNHTMQLISTDGFDIEPIELGEIMINNGERYDIVINANQTVDAYWIRVKALRTCQQKKLQQFAILRYDGSSSDKYPSQSVNYDYPKNSARKLSTVDSMHSTENIVEITSLRSVQPLESGLDTDEPDHQFIVGLGSTTKIKNSMLMASPDSPSQKTFQFDNISFKFPPSPLMTQHLDDPSIICNETSLRQQGKDCSRELCSCLHLLNVELNSIVEVILFDPDNKTYVEHPIKLHGYQFRVVGVGRIPGITKEKIRDMDKQGKISRNFDYPVQKDVVSVYKSGYTIIRFKASNPGYWFMPTTVRFHLEQGMALLFRVGDSSDLPPIPPGLPTCFNYLPT